MGDSIPINSLPPKERAVVALALLLDGQESVSYLKNNASEYGEKMEKAVESMSLLDPKIRLSLSGVFLRDALEELRR